MDAYWMLFLAALLSATLLPGSSEILFITLHEKQYNPLFLWGFATTGNILGSVVNWALGRYLLHYQNHQWFPFKPETLSRSQAWFHRYGIWSLLLAWAPVVGDGLTFIAGIMRIRLVVFLFLVAIGKGLRYAVILGVLGV